MGFFDDDDEMAGGMLTEAEFSSDCWDRGLIAGFEEDRGRLAKEDKEESMMG